MYKTLNKFAKERNALVNATNKELDKADKTTLKRLAVAGASHVGAEFGPEWAVG